MLNILIPTLRVGGLFTAIGEKVNETLRSLIWGLISVILWVIDFLWDVILKVSTLDYFNIGNTSVWFTAISTTMILFIVYRIVRVYIQFVFEEEKREKYSSSKLITKLLAVSVAISFAPIGFKYVNEVARDAITNMNYFVPGLEEKKLSDDTTVKDIKISKFLLQSCFYDVNVDARKNIDTEIKSMQTLANYNEDQIDNALLRNLASVGKYMAQEQIDYTAKNKIDLYDLNNWVPDYEDSEFDINSSVGEKYVYFPSWSSLFLMLGITLLAIRNFIGLALSIAKRNLLILIDYLLAPYAISSMIEPDSSTFKKWVDIMISDLIINFIQIYGTYFLLCIISSSALSKATGLSSVGFFTRIAVLIAALGAMQNIPDHIRPILGGSSTENLGASLRSAADSVRGTGGLLGGAGTLAAGAAGFGLGSAIGGIGGAITGGKNNGVGGAIKGGLRGAFGSAKDQLSGMTTSDPTQKTKIGGITSGIERMRNEGKRIPAMVPQQAVDTSSSSSEDTSSSIETNTSSGSTSDTSNSSLELTDSYTDDGQRDVTQNSNYQSDVREAVKDGSLSDDAYRRSLQERKQNTKK